MIKAKWKKLAFLADASAKFFTFLSSFISLIDFPFQAFLVSKTYIFIYVKNAMSARGWGGVKALADASAKNASYFTLRLTYSWTFFPNQSWNDTILRFFNLTRRTVSLEEGFEGSKSVNMTLLEQSNPWDTMEEGGNPHPHHDISSHIRH